MICPLRGAPSWAWSSPRDCELTLLGGELARSDDRTAPPEGQLHGPRTWNSADGKPKDSPRNQLCAVSEPMGCCAPARVGSTARQGPGRRVGCCARLLPRRSADPLTTPASSRPDVRSAVAPARRAEVPACLVSRDDRGDYGPSAEVPAIGARHRRHRRWLCQHVPGRPEAGGRKESGSRRGHEDVLQRERRRARRHRADRAAQIANQYSVPHGERNW
jgi:hypothetical protein